MNQREKLLLGLILVILLPVLTFFGWKKVNAMFALRRQQRIQVEKEIKQYDETILAGYRAEKEQQQLRLRSLPPNEQAAKNQYFNWLLTTAKNSGMLKVQVKPSSSSRFGSEVFTPYRFTLDGYATLDQLTSFLHKFYSSADLQRIVYFNFNPNSENHQIHVNLAVEAISLPDAPNRTNIGSLTSEWAKARKKDELLNHIVQRNIFAPANQPPVISTIAKQTVEKGKFLRLNLSEKAQDPDDNDKLRFALLESPEGARIDEETGDIRWLARLDPGEYRFAVEAIDSGFPPKTARTEFVVAVTDPPPPPKREDPPPRRPSFDEAKQTYLSAVVETDGQMVAWLHVRTSGKILKLSQGDEVNIGTVAGRLSKIDLKWVEIETDKGPLVVRTGQPLASGELKSVLSASLEPRE